MQHRYKVIVCELVIAVATMQQSAVHGQTVQGDILRGEGAYLRGAGWYNLNTAKANSINVDATIRWKQDLRKISYERRQLDAEKDAGKKAKKAEVQQRLAARERQLRTDPSAADIHSGEALNVLLYDLTDPDIELQQWQTAPVFLPAEMSVKDLIFRFIPASGSTSTKALGRGVIALSRLDIEGKWPTSLQQPSVAEERAAFEKAYANIRDQVLEGKFELNAVLELDRSLDDLKAKVQSDVPLTRGYRTEAARFVEELKDATRMFDATSVDYAREMLIDTKDHDATSVAELVAFMLKYRLQFASVTRSPSGRVLYSQLYEAMREQAKTFGIDAKLEAAAAAEQPKEVVAPLEAVWKGNLVNQKGVNHKVEIRVIARDEKTVTFVSLTEAGAEWEYDCEFVDEHNFKISAVRRNKADRGSKKPPPVTEITGSGTIRGKKLSMQADWKAAKLVLNFSATLQEP